MVFRCTIQKVLCLTPPSWVTSMRAVGGPAEAGRSPFAAREVPEVLYKIVYHYPPPPRHFAPSINLDVERVLALGLSKNTVHRFQTIGQLS